ncbi:HK97 gp10 family phage protein [Mycetocola saprophilus]|uniref:HK97 gp10 family phage protein n=1 Tax=Mycetocola saprophilus TaxID=76636 RepID=UPI0004C08C95|nr:HK97 gp10 family phage protein [Mycetocola saprophilus]
MADFKWNGPDVIAAIQAASVVGLNRAGERLKAVAVSNAPIEDGPLRQSGAVTPASDGDLEVTVSFNTPYAVRQHEELGWSHPRGGRAKYLEGPLKENEAELVAIMQKPIRQALK